MGVGDFECMTEGTLAIPMRPTSFLRPPETRLFHVNHSGRSDSLSIRRFWAALVQQLGNVVDRSSDVRIHASTLKRLRSTHTPRRLRRGRPCTGTLDGRGGRGTGAIP